MTFYNIDRWDDYFGWVEDFAVFSEAPFIDDEVGVNSREYLGKSAFIENLEETTVFESNMMNFSVDENRINPRFLIEQLQTPSIKNQILMSAKDAVNQSSINQQDIKALNIVIPDLVLQIKFETICRRFIRSREGFLNSQVHGEQFFNSLSQKAFAGKL